MNLSSVNTGGKVNKNDALFGSRFEDLQLKQMHAKNMYGVIVDGRSSVDTTNLFYSGHLITVAIVLLIVATLIILLSISLLKMMAFVTKKHNLI